MMDNESEYFRASVGALILDRTGRAIVFKRSAGGTEEWQLPQGGLLKNEEPAQAVYREIFEETAIPRARLEVIDEMEEWIGYELPESYRSIKTERGQVQKWYLLRFSGTDSDIRPDGSEFVDWQWMPPMQLINRCAQFRQAVYRRVLDRFAVHLAPQPW